MSGQYRLFPLTGFMTPVSLFPYITAMSIVEGRMASSSSFRSGNPELLTPSRVTWQPLSSSVFSVSSTALCSVPSVMICGWLARGIINYPLQRQVARFGCPACKNDLGRLGANQSGNVFPGLLYSFLGFPAVAMEMTCRITKMTLRKTEASIQSQPASQGVVAL